MAYIRGANYIWHDADRVHFWAADGLDNWQESGWIEDVQSKTADRGDEVGPSGVGVDQAVADLYVVMRFAELAQQRRVREIAERAVSEYGSNGGCLALQALAPSLIHSVKHLPVREEPR
jgi:hypothetical protein